MQIIERHGEVEITGIGDFDPKKIFECGQCFRWRPERGGTGGAPVYVGVAFGRAARVRAENGSVVITGTRGDFEAVWRAYFDLDRDYGAIRRALAVDDYMSEAVLFGAGLRILRQDAWEALCSFIFSQCNNIPRITAIVEKFCALYGEPVSFEGQTCYTFPTAERTAALSEEALAPIRCGFRAAPVLEAARAVAGGSVDLEALKCLTPEEALEALKKLPRVGDKVAHCVMLFGLHMLGAFPVDTWIRKTLDARYPMGLDTTVFGSFAGIAQQYMFYYARSTGK